MCKVDVSILTLRDWVGSKVCMSFIKSSEATIFRSILYKSASLLLFCKKGATREMACGWPPRSVHKWWSSILSACLSDGFSLLPCLSFWPENGVLKACCIGAGTSKSSLISSLLNGRKHFFSRSLMLKLFVSYLSSYKHSVISPRF